MAVKFFAGIYFFFRKGYPMIYAMFWLNIIAIVKNCVSKENFPKLPKKFSMPVANCGGIITLLSPLLPEEVGKGLWMLRCTIFANIFRGATKMEKWTTKAMTKDITNWSKICARHWKYWQRKLNRKFMNMGFWEDNEKFIIIWAVLKIRNLLDQY